MSTRNQLAPRITQLLQTEENNILDNIQPKWLLKIVERGYQEPFRSRTLQQNFLSNL